LQRYGLPPAPERKRTTTWSGFIRTHLALLALTDFFTAEVLTLRGLVTYYVLFFIHSRAAGSISPGPRFIPMRHG
jgi:putative transposase